MINHPPQTSILSPAGQSEGRAATDASFLSVPALRLRGWSPSMIAKLLGQPDKTVPNPVYRSQPPMRLYAMSRVLEIEADEEFAMLGEQAARRSAAAAKAAQTQRNNLLADVAAMDIEVSKIENDRLLMLAIRNYNNRQLDVGRFDAPEATTKSAPAFLERIKVNYARHYLTRYDRELERVAGKVGVAEAVMAIRRKVYRAIADAYPHLAGECDRQIEARQAGAAQERHAGGAR